MTTEHVFRHYLCVEPRGDLTDCYTAWHRARSGPQHRIVHQHAEHRLTTGLQRLGLASHIAARIVAHPSLGWHLVLADGSMPAAAADEHVWSVEFRAHG